MIVKTGYKNYSLPKKKQIKNICSKKLLLWRRGCDSILFEN